jgi:hypothetical protein
MKPYDDVYGVLISGNTQKISISEQIFWPQVAHFLCIQKKLHVFVCIC